MYGSWYMERNRHNFLSFWTFLPFYPPNNPEDQNFEKMKNISEDIILHMCNINGNHIINGSWHMARVRQKAISKKARVKKWTFLEKTEVCIWFFIISFHLLYHLKDHTLFLQELNYNNYTNKNWFKNSWWSKKLAEKL